MSKKMRAFLRDPEGADQNEARAMVAKMKRSRSSSMGSAEMQALLNDMDDETKVAMGMSTTRRSRSKSKSRSSSIDSAELKRLYDNMEKTNNLGGKKRKHRKTQKKSRGWFF